MTNLFNPLPFELKSEEIEVVNKMKDKLVDSNWTQNGKVQEKGQKTERLVKDILYLFDDIKIRRSQKSSVLDEVFKIDFVIETISDPLDVFAFQVKSSVTGALEHHLKNGECISWEESCIRTPWVLIIDGSLSNYEIFDAISQELCLDYSIDFNKLSGLLSKVLLDNNKTVSINRIEKTLGTFSKKEITALRLFFNVGKKGPVFYLKNK